MKALEAELDQCSGSALRKQLEHLQKQLELMDEEKKDTEERLHQEVKKSSDLESRGELTFCNIENLICSFEQTCIHSVRLMIRLHPYYL